MKQNRLFRVLCAGAFPCGVLFLGSALAQIPAASSPANPKPPTSKTSPDILVFTNGDQLTGKLEHATGGNVVFKSDMAGELTIPLAKVKELHSGSEFVALRKGDELRPAPLAAGAVTLTATEVTIQPTDGPEKTLPVAELGYLIDVPTYARAVDHHAGPLEGWSGAATGGLTLVRSTQKITSFTAAANFIRSIPAVPYLPARNRTTVNITETYGSEATPVIPQTSPASPPALVLTSIFHADAERDRYLTPRFFVLGDLSYDHNFSQGLQLQQLYGLGVGWTPVKGAMQELDLRVDTHYEKQQFLPASASAPIVGGILQDSFNLIGSTFQENYRRNLPMKFVLTEWANILPAWNDLQAYTANAYLAINMPLFKRLGATVSATDNYLNNPSPGYRTNSVQFVTGITYTLR